LIIGSVLPAAEAPPLSLTLMMGLTCCSIGLVMGILALGLLVRREKGSTGDANSRERRD
jgi:hypothetical protein